MPTMDEYFCQLNIKFVCHSDNFEHLCGPDNKILCYEWIDFLPSTTTVIHTRTHTVIRTCLSRWDHH